MSSLGPPSKPIISAVPKLPSCQLGRTQLQIFASLCSSMGPHIRWNMVAVLFTFTTRLTKMSLVTNLTTCQTFAPGALVR